MAEVHIQLDGIQEFMQALDQAARGDFKKEVEKWLNDIGADFLRVVQDEVIRLKVVDTRLLLNSFNKGDTNNVFKKLSSGLGIEVGTIVKYAEYVNTGHKLRNGAWWEGYHYFDNAKVQFERILNRALDNKLQEWMDNYF